MKAPDKIYMNPGELDERAKYLVEPYKDRDVVYIRKDALLDWAKRERVVGSDCKSCDGWAYAFSTMIEKLQIM